MLGCQHSNVFKVVAKFEIYYHMLSKVRNVARNQSKPRSTVDVDVGGAGHDLHEFIVWIVVSRVALFFESTSYASVLRRTIYYRLLPIEFRRR